MHTRLTRQQVLVVGGSSGLGQTIAEAFAAQGAPLLSR